MDSEPQVKKSMLDVFNETFQKQGKTEILNRIVYVAKITDGTPNKKDIPAYFELFFNRYHNEMEVPDSALSTTMTGILLVFQQTCVHLLEGSPKMIKAHLRWLHNTPENRRVIDNIKILVSTEDVPKRIFPLWVSRVISVGRTTTYSTEHEDVQPQVAELYFNLLQLGNNVSLLDKNELQEALDSLRAKYRDLVPSNEKILQFIQSDEIFKLEEWLQVYDTPVKLNLERDLIWPVP